MEKFYYLLLTLFVAVSVSCSNEFERVEDDSINLLVEKKELRQIRNAFEAKKFQSIEEAVEYTKGLVKNVPPVTRAVNEDDYVRNMYPEAMEVIDSFRNVTVDAGTSPETLRNQLKDIVRNSNLSPFSAEYDILLYSVDIAIEAIYFAMDIEHQGMTRGILDDVCAVVKCVGGTVGSAGLGALAGASVGTITLPVVGTVSGTAFGGWSGALVGAATFC